MRGNGGIVVQVRVTVQAGRRLPSILSVPTKRDLTPQGCELDHPASYNQLGYAHRFLENFSAAESPFTKLHRAHPERPDPARLVRRTAHENGPLRRFDQGVRAPSRSIRTSSRRTSASATPTCTPGASSGHAKRSRKSPPFQFCTSRRLPGRKRGTRERLPRLPRRPRSSPASRSARHTFLEG